MSTVEESKQLTVVAEERARFRIEYWAPRLVAALQRCRNADTEKVEAFAALGELLNEAKRCLGYGRGSAFAAMIQRSDLNIGRRMADKYGRFAKDKELRGYADKLPPNIDTIDKLGALPRDQFKELADSGGVTPKMRRKDVPRSQEAPPLEPRSRPKTAKELEIELDSIPWDWIVDETRSLERVSTWDDPEQYARTVARSYRRDFWNQQPVRVEVWSEKGTVRGVLAPVLNQYAVGFRVMHGFSGATTINDVAQDDDGRDLIVLYVGDFDPSGMFMSEVDLPARLEKYEGYHVTLRRIALTAEQVAGLPSFPASDKGPKPGKKGGGDPRYKWFVRNYGKRCWELDAMDPNDLRDCVEREIKELIEPVAWARCEVVNRAEQESLRTVLDGWPTRSKT
jgi:hypothetical protein